MFTEASLLSHPQSDLRLFHQHCLSLKTAFILGRRSEGERERKKSSTSGQWNCLVTQKGVIIEINHPILFHNWTLPWLTFQWHLPSGLSHHVHPTSVSFVCQEDSAAPLVGLVWRCEQHKKFPLNWQRPRLKLNEQKKNCWCLFLVVF